jgi:hypothetical protein
VVGTAEFERAGAFINHLNSSNTFLTGGHLEGSGVVTGLKKRGFLLSPTSSQAIYS